jgi:hypothetical protein
MVTHIFPFQRQVTLNLQNLLQLLLFDFTYIYISIPFYILTALPTNCCPHQSGIFKFNFLTAQKKNHLASNSIRIFDFFIFDFSNIDLGQNVINEKKKKSSKKVYFI